MVGATGGWGGRGAGGGWGGWWLVVRALVRGSLFCGKGKLGVMPLPMALRRLPALVAVRWIEMLAMSLPLRAILPFGRALGRFVAMFRWRAHVLHANVHALCIDEAAAANLRRRAFEHLGQALLLSLQPRWRDAVLHQALQYDAGACQVLFPALHFRVSPLFAADIAAMDEMVADALDGGLIISSAHLGIWELLPRLLALYLPVRARTYGAIVYRPMHNTLVDRCD